MNWRSAGRIGGVSITPAIGFSLRSGTASSAPWSQTTPTSSRRFERNQHDVAGFRIQIGRDAVVERPGKRIGQHDTGDSPIRRAR